MSSFPPYYQAARTHDRTETEIDFPVGLTPPTFDNRIHMSIRRAISEGGPLGATAVLELASSIECEQ